MKVALLVCASEYPGKFYWCYCWSACRTLRMRNLWSQEVGTEVYAVDEHKGYVTIE
jgi:hypothetical protein